MAESLHALDRASAAGGVCAVLPAQARPLRLCPPAWTAGRAIGSQLRGSREDGSAEGDRGAAAHRLERVGHRAASPAGGVSLCVRLLVKVYLFLF